LIFTCENSLTEENQEERREEKESGMKKGQLNSEFSQLQ
jgi:hypothetical protein